MNTTKTIFLCAAACAAVFSAVAETEDAAASAAEPAAGEETDAGKTAPKNDPLNAVVKLEVSTAEADVFQPWRTDKRGGDGSGS